MSASSLSPFCSHHMPSFQCPSAVFGDLGPHGVVFILQGRIDLLSTRMHLVAWLLACDAARAKSSRRSRKEARFDLRKPWELRR